MNVLFNSALKQSTTIRKDLDTFAESPTSVTAALQGQISTSLTNFSRTLTDYENLSRNELNADKKEKAGERLKNFRADLASYRAQFDELKKERDAAVHVEKKTELFGRRGYQANADGGTSTPENPYAQPHAPTNSAFGPGAGAHTRTTSNDVARGDFAQQEQNFFGQANAQIDEFLDRGRAVLGDLGQQREILKGTQKKLYSVANTLGVSGDTIRMVERRARQDKVIFWAGVAVFAVFVILVIYYLK